MKIVLVGYGAMGKVVENNVGEDDRIIAVVAPEKGVTFADIKEKPDVIIDFSQPAALDGICAYARSERRADRHRHNGVFFRADG